VAPSRDLCRQALDRKPDERDGFIRDACGGDDEPRFQVASILAREAGAKDFLDQPALEQAASELSKDPSRSWIGCVLYETLARRPAFRGATGSETIAGILDREPDWGAIAEPASPSLRRLLELCLKKDPRERLRDIGDARIEINQLLAAPEPKAGNDKFKRAPIIAVAGTLAIAVAASLALRLRSTDPQPEWMNEQVVGLQMAAFSCTNPPMILTRSRSGRCHRGRNPTISC
jgi:hypothetical protein